MKYKLREFVLNILEAMLGPHITLDTGKNHIGLVHSIGLEEDAQLTTIDHHTVPPQLITIQQR
jgi:hypothetical protein